MSYLSRSVKGVRLGVRATRHMIHENVSRERLGTICGNQKSSKTPKWRTMGSQQVIVKFNKGVL